MIKVESGIPIPNRKPNSRQYPWHDMKPGDSFAVPLDGKDARRVQTNVMSASARWKHLHGWRFTSKTFADHVRVWRIS